MRKIGKRRITLVLAIAIPVFLLILAVSVSYIGTISEIWTGGHLLAADLSTVPQSVIDDASRLTHELYGDGQEKGGDFENQLLAMYQRARDKDFIVLFNPGGWGWNLADASPGWSSIITGIKAELTVSGYQSVLLNYHRTTDTLRGRLNEMVEMLTGYSSKAVPLATRVQFLTCQIPSLKVIIVGESNGTIISDETMRILANNPRVYSIQTGTPFWHNSTTLDRTLILNDNGIVADSFSNGDIFTMAVANFKICLGLPFPEEQSGTIGHFVRAPGHDYWWQYPGVYPLITEFLNNNFGTDWQ